MFLSEIKNGCWECGIIECNNKAIILELEHIDENSENNSKENLSLLCPNYHSQTKTYKGKIEGMADISAVSDMLKGKVISRCSTTVVQRSCKAKVVGANPTIGTISSTISAYDDK